MIFPLLPGPCISLCIVYPFLQLYPSLDPSTGLRCDQSNYNQHYHVDTFYGIKCIFLKSFLNQCFVLRTWRLNNNTKKKPKKRFFYWKSSITDFLIKLFTVSFSISFFFVMAVLPQLELGSNLNIFTKIYCNINTRYNLFTVKTS